MKRNRNIRGGVRSAIKTLEGLLSDRKTVIENVIFNCEVEVRKKDGECMRTVEQTGNRCFTLKINTRRKNP